MSKNAAFHLKSDAKVTRKLRVGKSIPEGGITWYKRTAKRYKKGILGIKARNMVIDSGIKKCRLPQKGKPTCFEI